MQQELIVIASASEARVFKRLCRQEPLVPCSHLEHPQSRRKSSELDTHAAGHGSSDRHSGGVSFEPRHSPHEKEAHRFAREVARHIDQELAASGRCSLMLFCAAPFLGDLRAALSPSAQDQLEKACDVDLTSFGLSELEQRIEHHLHPHAHASRP